jgi:hypothetical protein
MVVNSGSVTNANAVNLVGGYRAGNGTILAGCFELGHGGSPVRRLLNSRKDRTDSLRGRPS